MNFNTLKAKAESYLSTVLAGICAEPGQSSASVAQSTDDPTVVLVSFAVSPNDRQQLRGTDTAFGLCAVTQRYVGLQKTDGGEFYRAQIAQDFAVADHLVMVRASQLGMLPNVSHLDVIGLGDGDGRARAPVMPPRPMPEPPPCEQRAIRFSIGWTGVRLEIDR